MRSSLRNRIQKPSECYLEWAQSPDSRLLDGGLSLETLGSPEWPSVPHPGEARRLPGAVPGDARAQGGGVPLPLPGVREAQMSKDSPCHLHVALPAVCPAGVPGGFSLTEHGSNASQPAALLSLVCGDAIQ